MKFKTREPVVPVERLMSLPKNEDVMVHKTVKRRNLVLFYVAVDRKRLTDLIRTVRNSGYKIVYDIDVIEADDRIFSTAIMSRSISETTV